MTNRRPTANSIQTAFVEDLIDKTQPSVPQKLLAIAADDSRRFLPTVLQCVQPKLR